MQPPDGDVMEEMVALADASGEVVGSVRRSSMRRENLWHIVVAVLVRDSVGRIYVHRRADDKDVFPGMYDCWAAGCLQAGETPPDAAARELEEELGVTGIPLRAIFVAQYADDATRHWCYAYEVTYEGPIRHQAAEISWGGWMDLAVLRARLADPGWAFVPDGRAMFGHWLNRSSP